MRKFKLFGIDLQNAFTVAGNPLCVPGAPEDVVRIAHLIDEHIEDISSIVLTVDTHDVDHIGHPGYWRMRDGSEPAPFTFITKEMLLNGDIGPENGLRYSYAIDYIGALGGAMVWPVHCVPETVSHEINHHIAYRVAYWGKHTSNVATVIKKGFDKHTESFGVFEAEYKEHGIGFNNHLFADLIHGGDPIVVVGEALSHCVKRSIEQMVSKDAEYIHACAPNIILLRDCMSSVPGFEDVGEKFLSDMKTLGVTVTTSLELSEALDA